VNPYELARLARGLGITTTEVISRFTVDGGTALATRADTACTFLGTEGCTVHADRPLVCRLYPLGRVVQADGSESFVENEPHPETEGIYGNDGTVGAYIESQSVEPFVAAADRYYAVFTRLMHGAHASRAELGVDFDPRVFIDADLAVQTDAASRDAPNLVDADALAEAHLALIERWAQQL
jgi:Fe-S-cluster containining protein